MLEPCVPLFATIVLRFATTDALICYILFHEVTEDRDHVFLAATVVVFATPVEEFCYIPFFPRGAASSTAALRIFSCNRCLHLLRPTRENATTGISVFGWNESIIDEAELHP